MKKIIFAITGLALVFSSCEDFLTKEDPMNQIDATALSTFDGINSATNGNYIGFASWYGEAAPLTFDVMCGNAMVGPFDSGYYRTQIQWSYTPNATLGLYSIGYNTILGCNKVLEAIEKDEYKRDNTVTKADIDNVKAENIAIRAMVYFDLVRVYGRAYSDIKQNNLTGAAALGVPLVTKDDLDARPARATVAELYDFIITELKTAEGLMETSYQRSGVRDRRATISMPVIQAALARAYLEHEDFQLAADYATKVINSGNFKLLSGNKYLAMWDGSKETPDETGEMHEIIYELFLTYGESSSNLGLYLIGPDSNYTNAYGDVRVSQDLLDLYDASDVRLTGLTATNETQNSKYRWSIKYPGKIYGSSHDLRYNNVPIIRFSEMYLIRAEALARGLADGVSIAGVTAIGDLNQVANSRGAKSYGSATIENIFNEARKEFLFEGRIFFDMKRLHIDLDRTDYDLNPETMDITADSYRWALPISKHEIDNNKNIVQNPGYNVQ